MLQNSMLLWHHRRNLFALLLALILALNLVFRYKLIACAVSMQTLVDISTTQFT